jgi:hypothetical protein
MILCELDAPEGDPGRSCVPLFVRILSTSFTSVSIFSVCCYSSVSISMGWAGESQFRRGDRHCGTLGINVLCGYSHRLQPVHASGLKRGDVSKKKKT